MSEKMTVKEKIGIVNRTIRLINSADKGHFRRVLINQLPQIITTFSGIYFASLVIDGVTGGKSVTYLISAAAVVCGIGLISMLISNINNSHQQVHSTQYYRNTERFIGEKVLNMDYSQVENIDTRNKLDNARSYVYNSNTGVLALVNHISCAFQGLFEIIVGGILIFPMLTAAPAESGGIIGFIQSGWGLLAVIVFCAFFKVMQAAVLMPKGVHCMDDLYTNKEVLQADRKRSFFRAYTIFNYQNGKTIRLYGEQQLIVDKYEQANSIIDRIWGKCCKRIVKLDGISAIFDFLTVLLLYGFAVIRASSGMMTAGEVVAFVMYFSKIQSGIVMVSSQIISMLTKAPLWQKLFDFLDIPDEKYKGTIPTEKRDDNEYEFEFRHVYFKYPDSEDYVLKDINLKWKIGEKMALVGKNGCGKSTLVKLLCRLYDPTEGEITLNGIDIRKYKYEDYMALFSVVFQDSGLFAFSIAENVAVNTEYDSQRVTDCVIRAGFGERLSAMEQGIETCLYKHFDEHGVEISGGEAQKLCLARAVYKGAPFIVLDEPTAALDPISEHDIYTKFNGIVGTRTAIYISHRLSSCRFCDEITVMENGRIAERGSHEKLLEQNGVYSGLWAAQAEYYKDTAGELFI